MSENNKKRTFNLPDQPAQNGGHEGFSVPDSYFDMLETDIISKIEVISSLENSGARSHFNVPADYFEGLPMIINEKILASKQKSKLIDLLSVFSRPQLAISFASLAILIWFSISTRMPERLALNDARYSIEQLNESEYLEYIDEYTIIELLASQPEVQSSALSNDPYVQYLLDHDIDISQIENSL